MSERRRWKRFLLCFKGHPTFHCVLQIAEGVTVNASLQDISCGGIRLEVNKDDDLPQLLEGQGVEFLDFDAPRFEFLKGKRGIVTWYRPHERQFGASFMEILRKGQVEDLLKA